MPILSLSSRAPSRPIRYSAILVLISAALSCSVQGQGINFNRDIRPILSDNCFQCHGHDTGSRKAKLRFDQVSPSLEQRKIIVPGKIDQSEMIRRISSPDAAKRMPPAETNKTLTPRQINLISQWIEQGADWQQHWAYTSPTRHRTPSPASASWSANWIDLFILNQLHQKKITPSPDAPAVTLLRRISFDLTGLPPTAKLAERFLEKPDDRNYESVVDALLKSPQFGERLAMYWLDLVRYADSVGYHGDQTHSIAPYRDWVIKAINSNMPFDQFTREQLAGDLLTNPTISQRVATGYNRLLQTSHEGGVQPKEYRAIYMADRIRNVSAVWMGATVGCAQCHDHKFDPYTARDFYSLGAFFADIDDERHLTKGTNGNPTSRQPELAVPSPAQNRELASLQARIETLKAKLGSEKDDSQESNKVQKDETKKVRTQIKRLESEQKRLRAEIPRSMITVSLRSPRVTRILPRGNWLDETGEIVAPKVPTFLGPLNTEQRRATRLDLANWLVDPKDGIGLMTARVMINRIWFLCFGSGLASNLDDFGGQGQPPVHPELLDRLAHEFVESGWDIKAVVRLIVMSRTYRQSSVTRPELLKLDPGNQLYARQSSFRLPAEMIRDNALEISGLLVRDIGGQSARPYQPKGYYRHLNFPVRTYKEDSNRGQWRRGLYVHWQRQFLHPMLKAFDAPSREECTAQRPRSNTPLAALTLLNDPTFLEAARELAVRMMEQKLETTTLQVNWLFSRALTRPPSVEERDVLLSVFQHSHDWFRKNGTATQQYLSVGLTPVPAGMNTAELAAWAEVSRTILNLAETNTRN